MRKHTPYYSLQIVTPDGRTLVCTSIWGDGSKASKLSLGFSDQSNYMLTAFGGHHFTSEKQAWWHWYKAVEFDAHATTLGKPKVVCIEP